MRYIHRFLSYAASDRFASAYSFLDPKEQGKLIAAYIVGIAVGQVVVFVIVWGLIKLRVHLVQRRKSSPDVQSEKSKSDLEA